MITTRWFESQVNAASLTGRTLARFSDSPEVITFKLDQKDIELIDMAERIAIDSWQFQTASGANEQRNFQILEINEGKDAGHDFTVKALSSSFSCNLNLLLYLHRLLILKLSRNSLSLHLFYLDLHKSFQYYEVFCTLLLH